VTPTSKLATPPIVSLEEWATAREELLVAEKAATRAQDALAAQRRRLPMTPIENHPLMSSSGPVTLLDLFGDHDELAVYQFMDVGPDGLCPGCSHVANNVTGLDELDDRGIAFAIVSNMPIEQIDRAKAERGWDIPFYSSRGTSLADDVGANGGFALSAFLRVGDDIFRTYSTWQRGVDRLLFTNNIQDLVAYGRQEDWEDSPEGWPQHPTYG
jgi:predicted dithiol-disulfide oxidoreductase (DUF899 family)